MNCGGSLLEEFRLLGPKTDETPYGPRSALGQRSRDSLLRVGFKGGANDNGLRRPGSQAFDDSESSRSIGIGLQYVAVDRCNLYCAAAKLIE